MNFPLILFVLLVITGSICLLDYLFWKKKRAAGESEPWWIEYPKSFFPIILIVFSLRSFVIEPFKIPSGSMIPVSYTHLRAHETVLDLVCRLLLEKKK